MNTAEEATAFLRIADEFRLGELPTEQPHPLTADLSVLAKGNPAAAMRALHLVDLAALDGLCAYAPGIADFAECIAETFAAGGRLFIAGCGATGRLALTVETLCRTGLLPPGLGDRVIGFMAGGDAALIRSLEGFEDYPEYGARQLAELGFRDGDLLVGVTEGGETPFVIGAVNAAMELSARAPWFCYCNPDGVLRRVATRSREVLDNPGIRKLSLTVGPMALAGSTRMQATTVQLAALLVALQYRERPQGVAAALDRLYESVARLDYESLVPFTVAEAALYGDGGHVLYATSDYGLTVLTDTTERAPTFSLPAFENTLAPGQPASLCYLALAGACDSASAWESILARQPRTLEWPEVQNVAGNAWLLGFDISARATAHRAEKLGAPARVFTIGDADGGIRFSLDALERVFPVERDSVTRNLCLKVLLNAHSTLVMGRLGRYERNIMTWVKPGNNKLIDRAIRYVRELCDRETGGAPDYAVVAHALFETRAKLRPSESIVLKTLERLLEQDTHAGTC